MGVFGRVTKVYVKKLMCFSVTIIRAALQGTNLRGQTPICGFLQVPVVFYGFLRKSAAFCENLRFPNALFSKKRRESAKISENLRLGSVCPLRFVPLSALINIAQCLSLISGSRPLWPYCPSKY